MAAPRKVEKPDCSCILEELAASFANSRCHAKHPEEEGRVKWTNIFYKASLEYFSVGSKCCYCSITVTDEAVGMSAAQGGVERHYLARKEAGHSAAAPSGALWVCVYATEAWAL